MQCHEFEKRWNEVLDERGDPTIDSQLLVHAERCPSCRRLFAGQHVLRFALRHKSQPQLPADFAHSVVHTVTASAPPAVRLQPRLLLAAGTLLSSAAAALIMVSLFWYARGPRPIAIDKSVVFPPALVKNGKQRPRPLAPLRSGRGGTLALAESNWLVEMPRLPGHLRDGIDDLADAFPETVERLDEAARLSPGIRPLRLSFALLWDTLLRALPGVRNEQPSNPPNRSGLLHCERLWLA